MPLSSGDIGRSGNGLLAKGSVASVGSIGRNGENGDFPDDGVASMSLGDLPPSTGFFVGVSSLAGSFCRLDYLPAAS